LEATEGLALGRIMVGFDKPDGWGRTGEFAAAGKTLFTTGLGGENGSLGEENESIDPIGLGVAAALELGKPPKKSKSSSKPLSTCRTHQLYSALTYILEKMQ